MKNNKIQLLGFCKSKATLLFDILDVKFLSEPLSFLLNMNVNTDIDFFTKEFPYRVLQPGTKPNPEAKYILAVSGPKNKVAVFEYFSTKFEIKKNDFLRIVHPTAFVAPSSIVREGCVIDSLVSISSQTEIGFGTDIKRGAQIGHHNRIGNFSDINPGAILCGYVTVGECCSIGAGAIIRDGITIEKNSVIGMGSVVTSDIPEGVIAYGNPCKVITKKET